MKTTLSEIGSLDEKENIPVITNPWHDAAVKMLSRLLHLRGVKVEDLPGLISDLHLEDALAYFSGQKPMPLNVFLCILFCLRMKISVEPMEVNFFNFMPQPEDESRETE